MACSVRLSHSIISNKLVQKSRFLPSMFLSNRYFCSKDGDIEGKSSTPNDSSNDKQEKIAKKASDGLKRKGGKAAPPSDEMKAAAKEKLKSLLLEIAIKSDRPTESKSSLNLAKAVKRISKKERLKERQEKIITPEKEMNMAVKAVASSFKDGSEKVESELSDKLSSLNLVKKPTTEEVPEKVDFPLIDEKLNANLMSSVEEVAATISEQPIPSRSKLTQRLMRLSLDKKVKSDKTMKSVIEGMVIKSQHSGRRSRGLEKRELAAENREQLAAERKMMMKKPRKQFERVNIFGAAPLNIFTPGEEAKPESSNTFWQKLEEKELRLLTQFAPANAFEEMIMWTEQGKHWKLPIDNQTEMGEEEKVGFHEHVFFEQYLQGVPTKGPIRHFMELVCVGLSKNPYLTVQRKVEHIEWFKNYFKQHEALLKDTGAI